MVEEYLNIKQAKEKIELLKKQNIVILYIERLVEQGDGALIADIAGIADFSDASAKESYNASLGYFSEYGSNPKEFFVITS